MIVEYIQKRDRYALSMSVFLTAGEFIGVWAKTNTLRFEESFLITLDYIALTGWFCVLLGLYFYICACRAYCKAKDHSSGTWIVTGMISGWILWIVSLAIPYSEESKSYSLRLLQSYLPCLTLGVNGLLLKLMPDRSLVKSP